ncbi:MAG: response regulator [Bacteroidales bacterium]|jgi:signal transduction histidine kinase/DNA-binding response OmpR family regulator/ligand-binding sensor domain-containing protein|nr:response regulator [Bacteroidales bacterium]
MKNLIFIVFSLLFFIHGFANNLVVQNYSTQEGLSQKTVSDIITDRHGFLWIATSSGLNKYDGYSFTNYFPDTSQNSISTLTINSLLEDSKGNIWIAGNSGIEYYNPYTETFHTITSHNNKDNFYSSLIELPNGEIWTCGINGIYVIRNTNGIYEMEECDIEHDKSKIYTSKIYWAYGYVWAASGTTIIRINVEEKSTRAIKIHTKNSYVSHMHTGNPNELIVVSSHNGCTLINTETMNFSKISSSRIPSSQSHAIIMFDAVRTSPHELLICTSVGFFSYTQNGITQSPLNKTQNTDLFKDYISCVIIEDNGNIWLGTYNYGIFSIIQTSSEFKQSFVTEDAENEKISVTGLHIFKNKSLIWGNKHGIFYNSSYTNISLSSSKNIHDMYVNNTYSINNDSILFISKSGTIYLYDNTRESFTLIQDIYSAQNVYYDPQTQIVWCATWGWGLVGFNIHTRKEYSIDIKQDDYYHTNIYSITGDSEGRLYLGMLNAGFIVIEQAHTENPKITVHNAGTNSKMHNNFILDMHNDGNGSIWIGTCYQGLYKYSINDKVISHVYKPDKEHTFVIEALCSDEYGNIWFSSNHSISKFDISSNNVTHYSKHDGIPVGFYNGIAYKEQSGQLFFGGFEGLIRFYPDSLSKEMNPIKPNIIDLKIFGSSVSPSRTFQNISILDSSIMYTHSIELPHYLNSISIDFASLNPSFASGIQYKYKLQNADKQWVKNNKQNRTATYSSLQPGTYTFTVLSSFDNSSWSEARNLQITILPPWWERWWFTLIVFMFIISGVYTFIYIRTRKIKLHNQQLEKKVTQRTEKLEESKLVIEMKNQELIEALQMKDRLIGVIGHDLRNPMSVLHNTLHVIKTSKSEITPSEFEQYLNNAEHASQTIINQLNMMVDWAHGNLNIIAYNPVEINIGVLIADAMQIVDESAREKNISIIVQSDYSTNAFVDPRMINVVFRNLLSNAIKFTPENGTIVISCSEDKHMLKISFIDTGIGIKPETLSRLFGDLQKEDISFGTHNESGSGLGLQVCKTFVEKNNGSISAQSSLNNGSVFTVYIPKGTKLAITNFVPQAHKQPDISDTQNNHKQYCILLIDDNKELMSILNSIFSEKFAVIMAFDGNKGLHLAQNMNPDIIISDINLPDKNGFEICSFLKENKNTAHIPIILISGDTSEDIEIQSYSCGANDFIGKPFNPEALIYKINALISFVSNKQTKTDNFILPESPDNAIVKKIVDIMNENLNNPDYSVDLISQELGLSRTQFWRKTKQAFNQSPGDLIRDIRLQKAKEMLESGTYRISDIAYNVGFNDPRYFSRCFSQKFGISPSEYHKNNS